MSSDASDNCEVLIAGAGPTGLVLALWLTKLGVRIRIVDKAAEPGTTSRALAVHARTLELLRPLDLARRLVEHGAQMKGANLWVAGRKRARIPIGVIGAGVSPFPYVLIVPQDVNERILIARLAELGVNVERNVELVGVEGGEDGVTVRLRHADGCDESCSARYLAGCDGAHSFARQATGSAFPGGTYSHLFYVADLDVESGVADGELHVALDTSDFLAIFPLRERGHIRLVGTIREDSVQAGRALGWDDVSRDIVARMGITVRRVAWFSTYRVHHRVADEFRRGRVFLLGDAAHIHSPVGGQGMNTGIGDAINLAWKLAAVLRGHAAERLLDSYEPERRAFAERLVATTDRAFTFVTRDGWLARFVRMRVVPALMPQLVRFDAVKRLMFRTVSQTIVNYRSSPLSSGRAGAVHGGDRLPWVRLDGDADNFAALDSIAWQVHVYGAAPPEMAELCKRSALPLHAFAWRDAMQGVGLEKDACFLVRPDGYIAWAGMCSNAAGLAAAVDSLLPRR